MGCNGKDSEVGIGPVHMDGGETGPEPEGRVYAQDY